MRVCKALCARSPENLWSWKPDCISLLIFLQPNHKRRAHLIMAEASPQLGYITAESLAKVIISQPELRDCLIIDVRGDVSQEMRKGCNHLANNDSSDSKCCAASRVSVLVDELGFVRLQSQVVCLCGDLQF